MIRDLRIPLLRDRHNHPLLYAAFLDGIDLNVCESREQAVRRIIDHRPSADSEWMVVHGWNNGRYALSAHDFDHLPPLAILNLSLHGLLVNAAGRDLLNRIDSDVANNLGNADWIERNLRRMLNLFAGYGASSQRLRRFYQWLLKEHGVYYAEEMLLVNEGEIPLFEEAGLLDRTRFWASPDEYERLSPADQQMIYGIKLFADGALGVRTAALHRPYRESSLHGLLMYEQVEIERLLRRYFGISKPIAIHAIGDRAIDQVVAAIDAVGRPASCEIRLEHAQLISVPTARRAKALGIRLCMQPNFSDDSVHYADRLPAEYLEWNNPFRMLIDVVGYVPGEDLLFGSDGMPHGVGEAIRQSLFPSRVRQTLTIDEFVAGYCLPDDHAGHIEVHIDSDIRKVGCRVVVPDLCETD